MKLTFPLLVTAAVLSMGFAPSTETEHAYAFDYDNDGSYAVSDDAEPAPATPKVDKPFLYPYGFDYDNDGSFVQMYFFQEPGAATPTVDRPTKFPYEFDRDNDGSYAAKPPATSTDETPEVEAVIIPVPLAVDDSPRPPCVAADATFYFPTDVSAMSPSASDDVERLVTCLNSPTMVDSTVEVIGHADPRGTAAYNRDLAMDRAESVSELLIEQGLDAGRIDIVSRGESMADDPELWDDRRAVVRVK